MKLIASGLMLALLVGCSSVKGGTVVWPGGEIDAIVNRDHPTTSAFSGPERIYLRFIRQDTEVPIRPQATWFIDSESVRWETSLPAGLQRRLDPASQFTPHSFHLFALPTQGIEQFSVSVAARVRELFGNRAVIVTRSPPRLRSYDTVVVSLFQNPMLPGNQNYLYRSLAPLDVGNRFHNQIAFVFSLGTGDVESVARAVVHAAGHLYGMGHSSSRESLMFAPDYGGQWVVDQHDSEVLRQALPWRPSRHLVTILEGHPVVKARYVVDPPTGGLGKTISTLDGRCSQSVQISMDTLNGYYVITDCGDGFGEDHPREITMEWHETPRPNEPEPDRVDGNQEQSSGSEDGSQNEASPIIMRYKQRARASTDSRQKELRRNRTFLRNWVTKQRQYAQKQYRENYTDSETLGENELTCGSVAIDYIETASCRRIDRHAGLLLAQAACQSHAPASLLELDKVNEAVESDGGYAHSVSFALARSGIGEAVPPSHFIPGDIIQLWRLEPRDVIREEGDKLVSRRENQWIGYVGIITYLEVRTNLLGKPIYQINIVGAHEDALGYHTMSLVLENPEGYTDALGIRHDPDRANIRISGGRVNVTDCLDD